ncbi:hypothetical protein TNCV_1959581 [Trichonephila clavipes]|nr:hypothetical protein TNCV_1959581 [Trichonephila clavipes]
MEINLRKVEKRYPKKRYPKLLDQQIRNSANMFLLLSRDPLEPDFVEIDSQPSSRKSSREVDGREVGAPPQHLLPQNWGGTELNRTVPYMVFKATANDRCTSSPLP